MAQPIREKRAGELTTVGLDLSGELGAETIQGVTSTVDTGLTKEGSPTYLGTIVYQPVSGGTPGNYYLVTFTVTTNAGSVIVRPVIVRVISDVKPTAISPTQALVSLEDAKAVIGKTTDEDTAIIELIISGVSAAFNSFTGRNLKYQEYATVYLDGNGEQKLSLPNYPVTSIGTVVEDDLTLTEGDDHDYLLYTNDNDAYLYKVGGTWTTTPKGVQLTVFKAGFSDVAMPPDLKMVCLKQVAWEFKQYQGKRWGEQTHSFEAGSVSFETGELLDSVKAILSRYRRLSL
jgi:hypothetical protein